MTKKTVLWAAVAMMLGGCAVCPRKTALPEPNISVFAQYVYQVERQRHVPLEAAAEKLYDLGVRGFDCHYGDSRLAALAATKLKPINLYGWIHYLRPDGGAAEQAAFLAAAEKHGVPRMMVLVNDFSGTADEEAEFRRIVAGLRGTVAAAKACGITVTIEDFGGAPLNPCNRMKYLKRFLDEIPDLRLALDSGNLYYARRGEDVLDLMRYAGSRVAHVHLKDQLASDQRTYAELGLGGVPNAEVVHHMAATGYTGWYTLENTVKGADVYLETVRQVAVLRAWVAEAGALLLLEKM